MRRNKVRASQRVQTLVPQRRQREKNADAASVARNPVGSAGVARAPGQTWREGRTFQRAYLIDLFQEMIEGGADFRHVDMHGGYMEIDTLEDHASAQKWWDESAP